MQEGTKISKKICVIGDGAVGKTSLIRRFVINKYDDKYLATIGTKTSKKTLTYKNDNETVNLTMMIWDILGQREFGKIQRYAYKKTKGAFIVIDLTRRETLFTFDTWLFSLYKEVGEIPVIVLVNKNDLEPEFGEMEINALLKDYGIPYVITSAKTGENVDDAFYQLGRLILEPWKGLKKDGPHEMYKILEKYLEPEENLERVLKPKEVEDIIMARYCNLLEDPDFAMSIIREQFKRAGVDFESPTLDGLAKAIDYLINVASNLVEPIRVEKERRIYINLINRIENKPS